MFEIIGSIVEACVGFVGGEAYRRKISVALASVSVGAIFFVGYGLFEVFSSDGLTKNELVFLVLFSCLLYFFSFLLLKFSEKNYQEKNAQ